MMTMLAQLRALTTDQRNAFLAAYLGWTLDAFDFFVVVFVLKDIEKEFHASPQQGASVLFATLACRPIGAFLFGAMADRYGRRIPLMIDVILYSVLELASGFAPTLTVFLVLRALFGVAMGGEWGLGASLALESTPASLARAAVGHFAAGLPGRLPAGGRPLPVCRAASGLALDVLHRRSARPAVAVHPLQSQRVARLGAGSGRRVNR